MAAMARVWSGERSQTAGAQAAPRPGQRFLVAEDNPITRIALQTLLEQAGFAVTLVEDGQAAAEAWAREPFDIILLDARMPVLDGLGATREVRRQEAARSLPRIPIIGLITDPRNAAQCEACGMDATVTKPVRIEALLGAIEGVVAAD